MKKREAEAEAESAEGGPFRFTAALCNGESNGDVIENAIDDRIDAGRGFLLSLRFAVAVAISNLFRRSCCATLLTSFTSPGVASDVQSALIAHGSWTMSWSPAKPAVVI